MPPTTGNHGNEISRNDATPGLPAGSLALPASFSAMTAELQIELEVSNWDSGASGPSSCASNAPGLRFADGSINSKGLEAMKTSRHVALVFGNDDEGASNGVGSLTSCVTSAKLFSDVIAGADYELVSGAPILNGNAEAMQRGISSLASVLHESVVPVDQVILYYAGHGISVNGRPYLIPRGVSSSVKSG